MKLVQLKQVWWPEDTDEQRKAKLDRLLATVVNRGFPVEVVCSRHQKKRSPEANAYLWAVCYPLMSDASGYEKEEIHFAMCCKFFGTRVVEIMGERFERPNRTTTTNEDGEKEWLGAAEFAELIDMVIREAAYFYNVVIPPPTPKEVPR